MENEINTEKRRNVDSKHVNKEKNTTVKDTKKKRKLRILDIMCILTVIVLLCVYVPRAYSLYSENKKEKTGEKKITYPLKVEILDEDKLFFAEFVEDYAIGILEDVDPTDGFDDKEKVNFVRHVLSEKYKSSGVVSKSAMNSMLKKYFDVEDLDYASLGFKKLGVYEKYESQYIYNITKLEQYDAVGEIYLAHADKIDKTNVIDGKYKEENVEEEYIFTLKKITEVAVVENTDATNDDNNTNGTNKTDKINDTSENEEKLATSSKYRYILEKVEKVVEEPSTKETETVKK